MPRRADSHKGENGKVVVIGGSRAMHGAPILSALAAEASGVDLIHLFLPERHASVARGYALNVQVHPFAADDLAPHDVRGILELMATMDCAVIGPGLHRDAEALTQLRALIAASPCPLVLDASALQSWTIDTVRGRPCICTPHLGELERMQVRMEDLASAAARAGITIHLKGMIDQTTTPDGTIIETRGGNAGLTVGGTGDALAGCIGGLFAQGMSPVEACVAASRTIKEAGDALCKRRATFTAQEVVETIPVVLREVLR